ncbi:MAG: N-acetylneuraminate synthase [Fidelibacterota bacterium]|nr:MAG: N-acetylneuraminate synthase [Candidatus Neomarinimicrobiota bacterium]
MRALKIAGHEIGPGKPCYIVAEAGVNHNGDIEVARQLVDMAVAAGADAVKFQTFTAEGLVTVEAPKADYQLETTDPGESQFEMLQRLELSPEQHEELIDYCRDRKIQFLSTPFDESSADFLDQLGLPAFKVGSGEVTNLPFLAHIARKGKPLILSTGMACLGEVEDAVRTIRQAGNEQFIVLHCVSNYPAAPADANLRSMATMQAAFDVAVGYSDHTLGIEVALAAVALGACLIEKHFTLDRTLPGPDHKASLEPDELKALVQGIRTVEQALGHGRKEPAASEVETAAVARKSLVAARDLPAGTVLSEDMIVLKRPGTGLPPGMRPYLVGRSVRTPIKAGTLLTWELLG